MMSSIASTTTSKSLDDDMDAKELIAEAMKELQEIKKLLGIDDNNSSSNKKK